MLREKLSSLAKTQNEKLMRYELMLRQLATAGIALLMPPAIKPFLLNMLGHRIAQSARIAPCFILLEKLCMGDHSFINFGNIVRCRRLVMRRHSYLDRFNRVTGPLSISLGESAALGRSNVVFRAPHPTSIGPAVLRLGTISKITSSHLIDCTCSISIGAYSIIAGARSQLWTHGYKHASHGSGRYRIDGRIDIGKNVYIGSASILNAGIYIVDGVTVGSHSSISKSLKYQGTYVSQPLRFLAFAGDEPSSSLDYVGTDSNGEVVYRKND